MRFVQASLVHRKEFIAIRKQLQDDPDETDDDFAPRPSAVRYLPSQYLSDSSLNADVSQFDFATSVCPSFVHCSAATSYTVYNKSLTLHIEGFSEF
jgi:hypothetical protein